MSRVRVKICGLTSIEGIDAAIEHGADAVGFVFAPSPRQLTSDRAAFLALRVPPLVARVAVFLHPAWDQINSALGAAEFAYCQSDVEDQATFDSAGFGNRFLPVVRVGSVACEAILSHHASPLAACVVEGPSSGTGQQTDWTVCSALAQRARVILAGGLNADNVAQAIRTVRPYAVDVSSGVESSPGVKDPIKIRDFIQAVREVEKETT
ncbi:MAG: phosphoribosylanthranilate isomerase [Phycisphaerales bacterium]